jgi:membrane protein implicated in regulation of membrane protease activity
MTAPLASALLDAERTGPSPGHDEPMSPRRAPVHGEASLANQPPSGPGTEDSGALASDVELATLGTELLAIPEIALILTAAGLLATAVWAAHPHLWQLGTSAAAAVAAASTSLHTVSPHPGALLLLFLATASLAMEVYSLPGLMLHAAGGATALAMAGLCLHGPWTGAHPGVAIPAGLVVGLGTWSAARRSWRGSRSDPWALSNRLVGRELVVLHVVDGHLGHAVVAGQLWAIRDPERPLHEGCVVRVTERRSDELLVQQPRQGRSETA